jgi:hypothetical protein
MSAAESHASARSGKVTGTRSRLRLVQPRLASFVCAVVAFPLALLSAPGDPPGAESNPPLSAATNQMTQTNSQELTRAYMQLQEQIRTTQLAIEQGRQETRLAAAQTAEALSKSLQSVQETFDAQRARDLEAMRSSNQVMLIVVGTFAAMSFLSMLMMSYFQWRMSKGLAGISAALSPALSLGVGSAVPAFVPVREPYLPLPETPEQREWRIRAEEQQQQEQQQEQEQAEPAEEPSGPAQRPILNPLLPDAAFWRRRQIRTWKTAVIVGLICAAVLAFLLYAATYGKLGFDVLYRVLKI